MPEPDASTDFCLNIYFLQDHFEPSRTYCFFLVCFFPKLRLEAFGSGAFYLSSRAGEDDVDLLFGFCAVVVNRPNSDGCSPLTSWPLGC